MAEPGFGLLPEGSLSEDVAYDALRAAGVAFGVPAATPELIRIGSNAVFRLPGQIVGRVASGLEALDSGRRQVRVAQWLRQQGLASVRAVEGDQPVVAAGCVVTFWHSVSDSVEYGTLHDLATLIRQLHSLPRPSLDLPTFDPRRHLSDRLVTLRGAVPDGDFVAFERRLHELLNAVGRVESPDIGPIHGDANIGNVIRGHDGSPVLMDLDNVAVGPREWDLVKTAVYYERFGWHTRHEYADFCAVLGADVTQWSGYPTAADLVEMLMTLWLSRRASHDAPAADETRKRVCAIVDGLSRNDWLPY